MQRDVKWDDLRSFAQQHSGSTWAELLLIMPCFLGESSLYSHASTTNKLLH
jgi:hypothetical protein